MRFTSTFFVLFICLLLALQIDKVRLESTDVEVEDSAEASEAEAVTEEGAAEVTGTGENEEVAKDDGLMFDGMSEDDEKALNETKEDFGFQAEVSRLMDIIINSLYKNREVFLRELISNASDALDKIRFLAVSDAEALGETKELAINVSFNYDKKTVTIRDTGVGMTKSDLINNLGTLASSGTKRFFDSMKDGVDMGLIGQFGVGFYSVYLVADKVRVVTKNNDDDQYIWESNADNSFTIAKDPRGNTLGRGTEITMVLKDDAYEFISQSRLENVIHRHSEFITFPIYLHKKYEDTVEVEEEAEVKEKEEEEEKEEGEDSDLEVEEEEEEEKPKKKKTEKVERWEWERLNGNVAIWARDKEDISDEEYHKFYQVVAKDAAAETMNWIHFKAEGEVQFKSIIYIPKEAQNLYDNYSTVKAGIRLYVRKVLIQDDFEDLLPRYLNFIKGVVDSDDLPLNVSRETLQQHKILKVMMKKLVRKVLEMLRKMSMDTESKPTDSEEDSEEISDEEWLSDPEHPYIKFWEQFGKSIKMGIMEDQSNKSKLAKLLRYKTSKSEDRYVSLDKYVAGMKDWQKEIYFVPADSIETAKKSPFMEMAARKDVEVLFLVDPVDEYAIQAIGDFDGYKLQSLTKEGLKFGDEDEGTRKKRAKAYRQQFKPLTKYMKKLLAGQVAKVIISQRVEKSPSVIVTSQYGHTANMERIIRAQTFSNPEALKAMMASKTLELNPRHPIIHELNKAVKEAPEEQSTKDLATLVFDTALLASGFMHEQVDDFANRLHRVMGTALELESLDALPEIEVEEDEEEEEEEMTAAPVEDTVVEEEVGEEAHDEF